MHLNVVWLQRELFVVRHCLSRSIHHELVVVVLGHQSLWVFGIDARAAHKLWANFFARYGEEVALDAVYPWTRVSYAIYSDISVLMNQIIQSESTSTVHNIYIHNKKYHKADREYSTTFFNSSGGYTKGLFYYLCRFSIPFSGFYIHVYIFQSKFPVFYSIVVSYEKFYETENHS